eukprot:1212112-Alexandrium_andersonii.AAC.1
MCWCTWALARQSQHIARTVDWRMADCSSRVHALLGPIEGDFSARQTADSARQRPRFMLHLRASSGCPGQHVTTDA